MIEREIDVQANGSRLVGTLCLPAGTGPFPLVLMIHGSGPLDRDQNTKGQKLDIFNTIACALAKNGIASVRFDKRGCGSSQGDYYTAGHLDLVDDVICWYDALHLAEFCRPGKLFLLGHSEGCLVAAQACTHRPKIAGLALLCPFVEPMEDILIRQAGQIEMELAASTGTGRLVYALVNRITGGPVAAQRALIRKIKESTKDSIRVWFNRIPAKWLRELLSTNISEVFRKITLPMLLVGGEKDLQCDPADVTRIAALSQGPVDSRIIPAMTHILRREDGVPTLLGTQRLLARPIDSMLLSRLVEWLQIRAEI